MLAHTLKPILELVPEALPMIKQAHVDEEFPLSNRDSCIASALCVNYAAKISGDTIAFPILEKVAKAVKLYNVEDQIKAFTDKMVATVQEKKASTLLPGNYMDKQANFEGDFTGFSDVLEQSQKAEALYKEAKALGIEPSDQVKRYSGHAFLVKEAAVKSLAVRYHKTNDAGYVKLAAAVNKANEFGLKSETIVDLCRTVSEMDKAAGLTMDFFKETLVTKEAEALDSVTVRLRGKEVPLNSIIALGEKRLAGYLGTEITREMADGPMNFKAALEALPIDSQQLLLRMTSCV
jgi:hypothetical protein